MLAIFMAIEDEHERNLADELFVRYKHRLYGYAATFFTNHYDVEDAVSDFAVKLMKSINKFVSLDFDEREKLLFCIARCACINKYKKDKQEKAIGFDDYDQDIGTIPDTYDTEEIVINREAINNARLLLDEMDPIYTNMISLRYYGYTFVEIAEMLGLTDVNMRVMSHRLKKRLIAKLGEGIVV